MKQHYLCKNCIYKCSACPYDLMKSHKSKRNALNRGKRNAVRNETRKWRSVVKKPGRPPKIKTDVAQLTVNEQMFVDAILTWYWLDKDGQERQARVYDMYRRHCGDKALSKIGFGRHMANLFPQVTKCYRTWNSESEAIYNGLKLKGKK